MAIRPERVPVRPSQQPAQRAPKRTVRRLEHTAPAPIVKWVGGKTKLLDELIARRPTSFRRYYEPFFGGGALFFKLAPKAASISDLNGGLVEMYRTVANDVEDVIDALAKHRGNHSEEHYYQVRELWNQDHYATPVERAAAFIYLNKTCYNGLWRVNRSGRFNVPVGRYTNPAIYEPALLRSSAALLRRARLQNAPYLEAVADAGKGDFVYFDPPYHPVSSTSNFTSYTSSGFSEDDQAMLAETAHKLVERGATVMLSNNDTPLIRKLYKGLRVDKVLCARAINSNASKRGAVAEVIAVGGI